MTRHVRSLLLCLVVIAAVPACKSSSSLPPECRDNPEPILILMAQAVPQATRVPCIAGLPLGWRYDGSLVERDSARFWLSSDVAGAPAVEVVFSGSCSPGDAPRVPAAGDEAGATVHQQLTSLDPFTGARYVVFDGGCTIYRFTFAPDAPATLAVQVTEALSFVPREALVRSVEDAVDASLCGAEAPPCDG